MTMYKLKQCWSSVSSVSNESGESIFSSVSRIIDVSRVSSVSSLRGDATSISMVFFIEYHRRTDLRTLFISSIAWLFNLDPTQVVVPRFQNVALGNQHSKLVFVGLFCLMVIMVMVMIMVMMMNLRISSWVSHILFVDSFGFIQWLFSKLSEG